MVEVVQLRTFVCIAGVAMAVGCRPEIEGRPSLIEEPTVLAMRSLPAEVAPGEGIEVTYEALFVGPDEEAANPEALSWQSCALRKPLTAAGAIHPDCMKEGGTGITVLGRGLKAASGVNDKACELFGPTPPTVVGGGASLRAADPDSTGGYYQPMVLRDSSSAVSTYSFGVTRLTCGIGAAAQEQVIDYNQHYRRNENPRLDEIRVDDGHTNSTIRWDSNVEPIVSVAAGSFVKVEVSWPSCPRSGHCGDGICSVEETIEDCKADCSSRRGCVGAETYLMFDPASRLLVKKTEQLRVSWYVTSGSFDHDRTGANVPERGNVSLNGWTAPSTEGTVRFWVVLRDDRMGVGWQSFELTIKK